MKSFKGNRFLPLGILLIDEIFENHTVVVLNYCDGMGYCKIKEF
jgi:hypothetical protein